MIAHREKRKQPVYALVVAKAGPKLQKALETDAPPTPPGTNAYGSEKTLYSYTTTDGHLVTVKQEGRGTTVRTGGRAGTVRTSMSANGMMQMELPKVTMDAFAEKTIAEMVRDRPVVDQTRLKGFYRVTMELPFSALINDIARSLPRNPALGSVSTPFGSPAATAPATDAGMPASDPISGAAFQAVQKLGLKLESRKASMEKLIIDHIEKSPTEN